MVFRKAHDSQLIGIRAALRGGASWEQLAEALGVSADFARKCFNEAIAERLDADAAACDLAGARPSADRPYRPDSRARSTASTRSRACSLGRRLVSQEEPATATSASTREIYACRPAGDPVRDTGGVGSQLALAARSRAHCGTGPGC